MPTRKIADLPPDETCQHPEHNPPSMRVFQPGVYEHACPCCGHTQTFVVRRFGTIGRQRRINEYGLLPWTSQRYPRKPGDELIVEMGRTV